VLVCVGEEGVDGGARWLRFWCPKLTLVHCYCLFSQWGKAVDTLLESDNIFISATQEMRYSFQKLTEIHCHYFYIVVMIIFI
jgi:hypothetical protein